MRAQNFAAAETHFIKAIAEAEKRGDSASKKIQLRLMLGEAQRLQYRLGPSAMPDADMDETGIRDKLQAAEQSIRSAIEIAASSSDRKRYVQCLDALSDIFALRGNYAAVEAVMSEAIRIERLSAHADPVDMARRTLQLGVARQKTGRPEEALELLKQALELDEQNNGPDHLTTARDLAQLGALQRVRGDYTKAEESLRRALRIMERELGYENPECMEVLHSLAGCLEDAGNTDAAGAQYERMLTMKLRQVGQRFEDVAEIQFSLARLYLSWQKYGRARELLSEALGVFRAKKDARLAVTYETLAQLQEESGRYRDAIEELERAAKVWESLQPQHREEWVRNIEYRADLWDQLGKRSRADDLREQAEGLIRVDLQAGATAQPA